MAKCFSYSGYDHTIKSQFVHISLQSLDLLVNPSCNLRKKIYNTGGVINKILLIAF